MQRVSEAARGRWHGILPQLGISPKFLENRHGPCPLCGGKDRFRFDDRDGKGTWICNKCGSGDGAELVKRVKGVEYKEAAKMIEVAAGLAKFNAPEPRYGANKDELNSMWRESGSITALDPVGRHLTKRCGIESAYPAELRYWGEATMLARVTDAAGKPVTLHRTFIREDGTLQRKLMPGKLPDNVAIRLSSYDDNQTVLGIAEGIETALSAAMLFHVPVWAAISATLLKKWRPPVGVEKVMIFGDNDESFTGQEAAYSLARALSGDLEVEVEVKIPSILGWDWNDVHRNNLDNR